ncbi:ring-cleaving dioxygenase [Chryseosolibacter indicus]|uniref:Ring-cleaving dioxygenase n=1 Tax=Chryseosolibacter indicus TaxID=2782351 RepID=A0ABS5VSU9_9BACT|nr:ring-cleaving dioxygenase [Chryseosolibacter indicus]MBT1703949.1 ring-cleaving dioxygenase [Chryseosolibacter indicus]
MENKILGIHHITAIAGNAKRNHDFYTKVLGLRLVKKTVNFDDPGTYHFYFGDEVGTPGTILTFFPWEGITKGRTGTGMATEIGYSVPDKSLDFWIEHFKKHNVSVLQQGKRFGEDYISITDPDGLHLNLIIPSKTDTRKPWETNEVNGAVATRGFHSIALTLKDIKRTAEILTDIFDYKLVAEEGNRFRFQTEAIANASIVDLIHAPHELPAVNAGGTIHHIAFRVKDENTLMAFREKIVGKGLGITPKIDRNYFFSLYFREPGGVLFELATDNPGFDIDERVSELGTNLKLPAQYEQHRAEIEKVLPVL